MQISLAKPPSDNKQKERRRRDQQTRMGRGFGLVLARLCAFLLKRPTFAYGFVSEYSFNNCHKRLYVVHVGKLPNLFLLYHLYSQIEWHLQVVSFENAMGSSAKKTFDVDHIRDALLFQTQPEALTETMQYVHFVSYTSA